MKRGYSVESLKKAAYKKGYPRAKIDDVVGALTIKSRNISRIIIFLAVVIGIAGVVSAAIYILSVGFIGTWGIETPTGAETEEEGTPTVNIAELINQRIDICISQDETEDVCNDRAYFAVAIAQGDENLCSNIINIETKQECENVFPE